jgi:taurine dioxygenase
MDHAVGFTVTPISGAGAAEVVGLDCSRPLAPADLAALRAAFRANPILAIRDQHLTPKQQVAFSELFGELESQLNSDYVHPDDEHVLILSNELRPDGSAIGVVDAGDFLHSDSSWRTEPCSATILYSVRNPRTGGDTDYCNMYLAYDALPGDLRGQVAGRYAIHHASKTKNPRVTVSTGRPGAQAFYEAQETRMPDVRQPMVRTHPETGRQALYISPRFTLHVEGMDADASEVLLQRLFAVMDDPKVRYRHRWHEHDLVMWDNRCLTHRATGGYVLPDIRRMHRTVVAGDAPFYREATAT